MEDITRDLDIGPELFTLLTGKVRTTRDALNKSLQENEVLREENKKLREGVIQPRPKEEVVDEQLPIISCQIGQCRSKDEADSLRIQLTETKEVLEATEHALEESVTGLLDAEKKYKRAKSRLKERQETIDDLQEQLRQIQEEKEELESARPKLSNNNHYAAPDGGEETIYISPDQPPVPLRWMTEPCMPPNMLPSEIPRSLLDIGQKEVLYWPGQCSVDYVNGSATLYAGQTRYKPGGIKAPDRWYPCNDFAPLMGKTREVFYLEHNVIRYAGTFRASETVLEYGTGEYRALSVELRTHILGACIPGPGHAKPSDIDRTKVADRYWAGEAKVHHLHWERIGYNAGLFHALVALRGMHVGAGSKGKKVSNKKRKQAQKLEAPANKKMKSK
ncbi:hypothetical protein BDY19DRAFT_926842 [Irpex rosettiformis]|uniref:Uncharacterized protein n=1 Tax=Irpex rosettiformis TaxID=378272 RepID=A0ACB8UET1_9APHY|nr:hypothetical protein BDY19DRAFT_926842 [Irpex rosettiformis]